ncbi:methyl-accepting chemotaxis protein [Deferribacter thermophilus]|uniref:methyl-accepting chemotaxis protein n=1 Tax=Deferribacter thermophilus TaxID=53573 RepID=UPI003C1DA21F
MKKISLKNILILRIFALTLLFAIFAYIFYSVINNQIKETGNRLLKQYAHNIKWLIYSEINTEENAFDNLALENLEKLPTLKSKLYDVKTYKLESSSLPKDLISLIVKNKQIKFVYLDNSKLVINRYLLIGNNIHQLIYKAKLDINNSIANIIIKYNSTVFNSENKKVISDIIIDNSNNSLLLNFADLNFDIYFIPKYNHFLSSNKVVSIIILTIFLYIIWLITELLFIRFSTKPLFNLFTNFKAIKKGEKEVTFKDFNIIEYDLIAKAAEETLTELKSNELKVLTILSRLPIPVAMLDKSLNIIFKNRFFDELFNLDKDTDYNFYNIIPESLKILEENLDKFVNSIKQKTKFELFDVKNNAYFIVRLTKLFDTENKLLGYLITFHDITSQKIEQKAQEERANKLEKILLNIEEAVSHLTSSSSELETNANSLSAMLAQQNATVAESNTSIMELNTSTEQILTTLNNIAQKSDTINEITLQTENSLSESNEGMKELTNKVKEVFEIINNLNNKTNEIKKILKTIYEISEQTNILSLNASIEAVRESSTNESFKIIAEEIRDLAEKTYNFTSEIENNIEQINNFSTTAVMIAEETIKNINEGYNDIKSLSENFEQIFNSLKDLNTNLYEIINSVKDLKQATNDISNSSNEITMAMKDALNAANNSLQTAQDIKAVTKTLKETMEVIKKL